LVWVWSSFDEKIYIFVFVKIHCWYDITREVKCFERTVLSPLTFKWIGKMTYRKSQREFPLCSTQKSKNSYAVATVIHLLKHTSRLLLVWYQFRVVFCVNHVSEGFRFPRRKLRFDFHSRYFLSRLVVSWRPILKMQCFWTVGSSVYTH